MYVRVQGSAKWGQMNIFNEKFGFVRSTVFQLLWQIKGKTINYLIFNVNATFC
jgi:hypothetical protein